MDASVQKTRIIRREGIKYLLKIPRTGLVCLMLLDWLCFFGKNKVPIKQIKMGKKAYHIEFDCSPDIYEEITSYMEEGMKDLTHGYIEELSDVLKNNLHNLSGQGIEKKNSYGVYFCENSELSGIAKNIIDFISTDYQK